MRQWGLRMLRRLPIPKCEDLLPHALPAHVGGESDTSMFLKPEVTIRHGWWLLLDVVKYSVVATVAVSGLAELSGIGDALMQTTLDVPVVYALVWESAFRRSLF